MGKWQPAEAQLFQQFYAAGAEGYDILFGRVPRHFANPLLRAARLNPAQRVLDVTTGSGFAPRTIADAVEVSGHVTAVDISRSMLAGVEQRLAQKPNIWIEGARRTGLRFADGEFVAVVCSLALTLFSDPSRGTSEVLRVLRAGGRAGVLVETTAQRSVTTLHHTRIAFNAEVPLP